MKSMTGYGHQVNDYEQRRYTVEIRTVNHKYHDISLKMSRNISYLECKVRNKLKDTIQRGKIDVSITMEDMGEAPICFNQNVVKGYIQAMLDLQEDNNIDITINMADILALPDVLKKEKQEEDPQIEKEVMETLEQALQKLIQMRATEGEKIQEDLKQRIQEIQGYIEEISTNSTGLVEEYVVKLRRRIKELLQEENIDENRILMETVIFADKSSIEEELTRLRSHIAQFCEMLKEDHIGKKMDFLIQEMNREVNTIASKANCLNITKLVVETKNELENIREQVQNIE